MRESAERAIVVEFSVQFEPLGQRSARDESEDSLAWSMARKIITDLKIGIERAHFLR